VPRIRTRILITVPVNVTAETVHQLQIGGLAFGARVARVRVNPMLECVHRGHPREKLDNALEVIALRDDDRVIGAVQLTDEDQDLVFITSDAQLLRFSAGNVRPQGRSAGGMAGIRLAARASVLTGQNERAVFEVLLQREKLGTTAVGYGVAIPHGKLPKLEKLFGLFARLERPIDFEAMDGQPVDLVFLLLAPEGAGADHLKALARIARLLRDQDVAKKLRASRDAQAIYSVLALPPASAA